VKEHLEGKVSGDDSRGRGFVRATRIFVRRQRTWLARDQPIEWIAISEFSSAKRKGNES